MGGEGVVPIVVLPPNFIRPNRRKGTETIVTPGTISRMTAVRSGSVSMPPAIIAVLFPFIVGN